MNSRMTGGRIALVALGSILALISLGLLAGEACSSWAHATQRDDTGFYSTGPEPARPTAACDPQRGPRHRHGCPGLAVREGRLGTIRLIGRSLVPGKGLFIGIGPEDDVERFLNGVEHDVLVDVRLDPFRADYRRARTHADAPFSQEFWAIGRDHAGSGMSRRATGSASS